MGQSLLPSELIVIDDGSSDESPQIIERVLKGCSFPCEFIVRANRGLSATLNEGLRYTRGRYFAYLGSDDLWLPGFLTNRVELLEARTNAVLAYGGAYSIDEADTIIDCTTDWARYVDGDARAMLLRTLTPHSSTVVYRREVLPENPWNEHSRLEDYELYLRLSARGEFAFDPRVLSCWRQHNYNASQNVELMLAERLAAQQRTASQLGLTGVELAQSQSVARFRGAVDFMRKGRKLKALKLFMPNLFGAPSLEEAARLLVGLLAPQPLLRFRKQQRRLSATRRYGGLLVQSK
jgi:glycosyltransferase involved in cell wall biosynthesis